MDESDDLDMRNNYIHWMIVCCLDYTRICSLFSLDTSMTLDSLILVISRAIFRQMYLDSLVTPSSDCPTLRGEKSTFEQSYEDNHNKRNITSENPNLD